MKKLWGAAATLAMLAIVATANAGSFSKDSLVWKKCTDCHEAKDGKIARIESIRTTPEEWRVIVDRMKRLYGMDLGKGEMETLLKELCATQILTPDEQAKVSYLSLQHNSQFMESPNGPDQEHLFVNCVRCHSVGKIFSYRMTPDEWKKVRAFHLYMTPTVYMQMRELRWLPEAEKALAYLAKEFAFDKPWKAPDAKLGGSSWVILGREPGKGEYRGEATFADKGAGDYSVKGLLRFADGTTESFDGSATLYGGYALRSKTRHNGFDTFGAYILSGNEMKGENHFEAPDFRTSTSVWMRQDGAARALRMTPSFLVTGEETTVTIEGMNLPDAKAADLAFSGAKVEVLSASRSGPDAIVAKVVSRADKAGQGDVEVKGAGKVPFRFAPAVESIVVSPSTGRARLAAGPNYPAEGVQFEAVAFAGDLALGPVAAKFHLEEESTREHDDDLQWVGGIGADGRYIPIGDYAPLASRKYHSEASGWVKVVADYERGGKAMKGEAKMAVTMPDFIPRIR